MKQVNEKQLRIKRCYNNSLLNCTLTVFNGILYSSQAVVNGIFDLSQRVLVWAFHKDGNGQWVLAFFNKRILLLTLPSLQCNNAAQVQLY